MTHPDATQTHERPADEQRHREAALDETLEGSFPSSDPPSTIPNPDDHDAIEHDDPAERDRAHKARRPEREPL